MPDNKISNKKTCTIVPVIYVNNAMGGTIAIRAPVLLSIFQSEEILNEFRKNPHKKYSVKEIFDMRCKEIPVKEATVRRVLTDNKMFFETTKDIEIRGKKGKKTVMVINFTKLKPISEFVFKAVEELWENENEK